MNERVRHGSGMQVQARHFEVVVGAIRAPTPNPDDALGQALIDGAFGCVLDASPLQPVLASTAMPGAGARQTRAPTAFACTQVLRAPLRDRFHAQSRRDRVRLPGDGSSVLDCPLNDCVFQRARRALLNTPGIQFAAGARTVTRAHERCPSAVGPRRVPSSRCRR